MPIGIILLFLLTICKKILEILAALTHMISGLYIIFAALGAIVIVIEKEINLMNILGILAIAGMGVGMAFIASTVLLFIEFLISKIKSITFSTNYNANYSKVHSISSNVEKREYVSSKINNIDTDGMTDDQIEFLYTQVLNKN